MGPCWSILWADVFIYERVPTLHPSSTVSRGGTDWRPTLCLLLGSLLPSLFYRLFVGIKSLLSWDDGLQLPSPFSKGAVVSLCNSFKFSIHFWINSMKSCSKISKHTYDHCHCAKHTPELCTLSGLCTESVLIISGVELIDGATPVSSNAATLPRFLNGHKGNQSLVNLMLLIFPQSQFDWRLFDMYLWLV